MATCLVCGNKAGAFNEICQDCEKQRIADEMAARDERILEERAEAKEKAASWQESFVESITNGATAYAYRTVYVPIDSVVNGESIGDFDISDVQKLGLWGWKIVGIMPRTVGIGLTNVSYGSSSGETWGAGLGGNVAGVYVLLAQEVKAEDEESIEDAVAIGRELIEDGIEL